MRRTLARLIAGVALLAPSTGLATKVPATVNIGFGPTIGTVLMPSVGGPTPLSVGVALRAEGWVSKKTLHSKKVMRRVPKKYKGMVRSMDDMHVVPMPVKLVPDQAMVAPINEADSGAALRAVGWTPISLYLAHRVRPAHATLGAAPRVGWVSYDGDTSDDTGPTNHFYLGLDLGPEYESPMQKKVGVAAGANIGPGLLLGNNNPSGEGAMVGVWVDGFVRLHIRKPIKVSI